jgi:hypothetical protein
VFDPKRGAESDTEDCRVRRNADVSEGYIASMFIMYRKARNQQKQVSIEV